jgi:hypothetical protein
MQFVQGIFMPKYDPTIEDVYKKVGVGSYSSVLKGIDECLDRGN